MKRWMAVVLMTSAALAHAQSTPAKKELVNKLLQLQQPGIEMMAQQIVERPAVQLMQQARAALAQVPADKRDAAAKAVQADLNKYVEEAAPPLRDRAVKLAPATVGPLLEEKFSEDELKQLIAWIESPLNKKYQQLGPEMQNSLGQKLMADAPAIVEPKLQALQVKLRSDLGLPAAPASASTPKAGKSSAKPAAKAASK